MQICQVKFRHVYLCLDELIKVQVLRKTLVTRVHIILEYRQQYQHFMYVYRTIKNDLKLYNEN